MTERYPQDAALLALDADPHTGVEYIPTGTTPYVLPFRRLVQRTLLAAARSNDLRVYAEADLFVGVRPGRCLIDNTPVDYPGAAAVAIEPSQTTDLYLDAAGTLQLSTAGLPAQRSQFIPLARITTDASAITALVDLRGEAFLASTPASIDGLNATPDEINQALDGIGPTVSAITLNLLTNGSYLQDLHYHERFAWNSDTTETLTLLNIAAASPGIALRFHLPNARALPTDLALDPDTGFLTQTHDATTYPLVGVTPLTAALEGPITASSTDRLLGPAPVAGTITAVVLSLATNLQSSNSADGIAATVYRNGDPVCSTDPSLNASSEAGFVSTQSTGTPAVVQTNGNQTVQRGDVLTFDLTRTANGSVTTQANHAALAVIIRPDAPE
ncbi:MAG: hypothetical protein AAF823_10470 [Planctomycetota bacterium]